MTGKGASHDKRSKAAGSEKARKKKQEKYGIPIYQVIDLHENKGK